MRTDVGRAIWLKLAQFRRQRRVQNLLTLGLVALGPILAMATFFMLGPLDLSSSVNGLRLVVLADLVYILVVAALVTPPDVTTQLILFVVVFGLYEISIHLVAAVERRKDKAARAEGIIGEGESLFDTDDDDEEAADLADADDTTNAQDGQKP